MVFFCIFLSPKTASLRDFACPNNILRLHALNELAIWDKSLKTARYMIVKELGVGIAKYADSRSGAKPECFHARRT